MEVALKLAQVLEIFIIAAEPFAKKQIQKKRGEIAVSHKKMSIKGWYFGERPLFQGGRDESSTYNIGGKNAN